MLVSIELEECCHLLRWEGDLSRANRSLILDMEPPTSSRHPSWDVKQELVIRVWSWVGGSGNFGCDVIYERGL